jgi:hypothetical protein
MGVPNVFGSATTSIPLSQLDANFNTGLTIGNTTIGLGNTTTTLGNVTLTNATISSPSGIAANAVIYSTSTGNLTGNASVFSVNSGNIGINTSSPARIFDISKSTNSGGSSVFPAILVRNTLGTQGDGSTTFNFARIDVQSGNGVVFGDIGTRYDTGFSGMYLGTESSHPLYFQTVGTERMRITSAGEVAIGLTSVGPGVKLDVAGVIRATQSGSAGYYYRGYRNSTTSSFYIYDDGSTVQITNEQANPLTFGTSNAERMRITSAGDVGIGTTTPIAKLAVQGTGYFDSYVGIATDPSSTASVRIATNLNLPQTGIEIRTYQSPASGLFMSFLNLAGNVAGSITHTGTTTVAYNTSSDYRLKENVKPMVNALAKVAQLKPCTYTWKEDGIDGQGFIAHELQAIVPDCVSGEKDAVDTDGNPKYQGVDTSFLVATLTAAIQELNAKVDELQTKVGV